MLSAIERTKPHATLVHIIGQPPEEQHHKRLGDAVRRLGRHGASITWSFPEVIESVKGPWDDPYKPSATAELPDLGEEIAVPPPKASDFPIVAPIAADAIAARVRVAHLRRETSLRKLGIRVVHARRTQRAAPVLIEPEPSETQDKGDRAPASPGDGASGDSAAPAGKAAL